MSNAPAEALGQEGPELPVESPESAERVPKKPVESARETRRFLEMYKEEPDEEPIDLDAERPKTRADCIDGPRPCPFVGCRFHLFLEVTNNDNISYNFPGKEPDELEHTCSLDLAGRGGMTLEDTGDALFLTRERIRQIEVKALHILQGRRAARALREEHDGLNEKFSQGIAKKVRYTPTPKVEVPPPAIFFSPKLEPAPMPVPEDLELDDQDDVEEEPEEELEEELEETEEAPAPPPKKSKKDSPVVVTELTSREKRIYKNYMRIAEKTGAKPSPLKVALACKMMGSNAGISANVCTALKAIARKGFEVPYLKDKASRGPDGDNTTEGGRRRIMRQEKRKKREKSAPAIPAELVSEVPPTAMVAVSQDPFKHVLQTKRETLLKQVAAIDLLLST